MLFTRKENYSVSHEHSAQKKDNHWLSLVPHEAPHRSGTSATTPGASDMLHPLDPLSAHEIAQAVQIVRTLGYLTAAMRILSITLHEPPKATVFAFDTARQTGTSQPSVAREVELVVYDPATNTTVEAVVSLTTLLVSWQRHTGVQPAISFAEVLEVERVVKAHPLFAVAMATRGITDLDLIMVDSWPAGNYGPEDASTRRLGRPLVYVKQTPEDNGYAHPVDGLHLLVDLAAMQVLDITDTEVIPLPMQSGEYLPEAVGMLRTDLRPLVITQPDGPSFTVNGYEVRWQKWRFRLGWTPREGLVLYTVGYEDQGRLRPILYRASLAEMVVPYGDPSQLYYRRNVLDMGEHGLGVMANALERGCDCLGHIHYVDAYVNDMAGNPVKLPNAICLHEEDAGLLWKHTDFRTGTVEVRRSRRLVVSFIATVGIYDYGFYWAFYQDGSIGFEVKLTGIMNTRAMLPGEQPKYGTLVAPQLCAIIHQHFFNVRLDMMVDGLTNSVYESHLETEQPDANPYGNAFFARDTLLKTEQQAQQVTASLSGRTWKVVNPQVRNGLGQPVGYQLLPQETAVSLARPLSSSVVQRAAFITKNLWVTPYTPDERYPAGEYPNQHAGGAGLPQWTQANRSIVNTNVVLWYTLGVNHVPRPEDWPVMPVRTVGFRLQPFGFFDRNPALDVPPPPAQQEDGCDC
jgi:primary-amine oxidase